MLVIDASAAIGIVRAGGDGASSARLMESCEKVIAPEFFCEEVAQVAWKYAHVGALDREGAIGMARAALGCVDEFFPARVLLEEALAEAVRLDHSFYDMVYFVLARRTPSCLLTCDKKLAKLCHDNGVECVELIDFV